MTYIVEFATREAAEKALQQVGPEWISLHHQQAQQKISNECVHGYVRDSPTACPRCVASDFYSQHTSDETVSRARREFGLDCVHGYINGGENCPTCEAARIAQETLLPELDRSTVNPGAMDVAETWSFGYIHGAAIYHLLCSRTLLDTRQEHLKRAQWYIDRLIAKEPENGTDEEREGGEDSQESRSG